MPWSGGVFTRTNGTYTGTTVWQQDAAAGVKVTSARHDTHDQDLSDGISACLRKDLTNATVSGRLNRVVQVVTAGTSYTTASGTRTIIVELFGGGGGGAGAPSAAASASAGGSGGAGGYAKKQFTVTPATAYVIAIGAGGVGGNNTGQGGSDGGDTTFTVGATTVTAFGGRGAQAGMVAGTTSAISLGGASTFSSTNGDINGSGEPGQYGIRLSGTLAAIGPSGGNCYFAGTSSQISTAPGSSGHPGCGGGGALVTNGGTANAGGDGGAGFIVVYEYT